MKFQRILCPTDFSPAAYEALKAAASLALDYSSELLVVNVVEPMPVYTMADTVPPTYLRQYMADMKAASREQMNNLVNKVIFAKIRVKPLIESGPPADRIVEAADRKRADLIVIATHGHSGWRRFVFGSVTERVIKSTTKPVLIIQPPQK